MKQSQVTSQRLPVNISTKRFRKLGERIAASLAFISAFAHIFMPFTHHSSFLTWLMVPLALTCLWCAVHLWRGPVQKTWWLIATMYTSMLILHGILIWRMASQAMHVHQHMESALVDSIHEVLMNITTGISIVLVLLAVGKIWFGRGRDLKTHQNKIRRFNKRHRSVPNQRSTRV